MKRTLAVVLTLILAAAVSAQQPAPAPKIVAVVNGETITKTKIDALYDDLGAQVRSQYDKNGGKLAFLDNYVAKRLLVQEAIKSNFDQRPAVKAAMEAAKESVLFDHYVRDVIAAPLITEAELKKFYDEHPDEFVTPEAVKVRHIVVIFQQGREKEQALEQIKKVMAEIRATRPGSAEVALNRFAQAAAKYSEDGTGENGGDLGWVEPGKLDPQFEEIAFKLQTGIMSGIVETPFGYHLMFVEAKRPAGKQSYEEAKNDIREFIMTQRVADVMTAVQRTTGELRRTSKIAIFRENLD